ncbi:MAG: single-stranded-DNA-specific exonuclease RecJ [Anaerolineae bacterium]
MTQILYNRGIYLPHEVRQFINGATDAADPGLLKDVPQAAAQILAAIKAGEQIVVYGDYDADGVTATVLMVQVLAALGANVQPYIPDRFEEGYGLNTEALDKLAGRGAALVVTVDCGIRSVEEVAHGNSLGLRFIITDHHQVPRDEAGNDVLPPAAAVINPKRRDSEYPFADLAGVGVAYKLAQALIQLAAPQQRALPALQPEALLDLVAIGTVADMVPLIGENRSLVKQGLACIRQPRRVGLQTLIEQGGLQPDRITAGTIGFVIGPRLNAAGRLTHARIAYRLLATEDRPQAQHLAAQLTRINAERQELTRQFVEQARTQIMQRQTPAPLYLICDPEFNHGVVGLVASRLTDEFYRPMLVAHRGEQFTRGSGRSIPEFDITRALDRCADLLERYGGHAAAAGFTIKNSNVPQFEARLTQIAQQVLAGESLQKTVFIDAEINLKGVTPRLVEEIQNLRPFGYHNPTPRFVSRGLQVRYQTLVGKDRSHLKLKLFDGKRVWDAIGFGLGRDWASPARQATVDAVYTLEFNTWRGQNSLQLNVKDLKLSQA